MRELWLYDRISKFKGLNYRAKIMIMAFIGTHIPLIVLASYFALRTSSNWNEFGVTVGVTLVATLVGTAITLFVLDQLLRPVVLTARTLRGYRHSRDTGSLPIHYTDEVGTLMADASHTLAHLEDTLDSLEHIDPVTGLPNRKRLELDLARRMPGSGGLATCALHFTNYERIKATFDSKVAEAAVKVLASRAALALQDGETLYRVGGGEFIVLTTAAPVSADAAELAISARVRALRGSCTTIAIGPMSVEPVVYGGVALYPQDADRPDLLVDHALAAAAQASDAVPISYHSPASRTVAVERLQLEQDLRRALARSEFLLHYQPVVDLSIGRTVGAEALIRWQHPERGLVPPMKFIGLAETTGLIDPMGLWVMRSACQQVRKWNDSGRPGLKIAINLSARQFLDPDLVGFVDEALRVSGIAADQLEIELTETAAMADHAHTKAMFGRLRDLGVSIAIDDFGTGYASMSYLRKLPFDKLKIDREFVSDVHRTRDSQAICGALVTLARGLGLRVLAEGTESADEVRYLRSRGCDLYQGFYFSKPLSSADFEAGIDKVSLSAGMMGRQTNVSRGDYALAS